MSTNHPSKCAKGSPLWLATFADLMSLLMCFFVLLLSFATMDADKFKQLAFSMENAFGVQRDIPAIQPPMGTRVIAQRFSPAQTTPTPIEAVKQMTRQKTRILDLSADELAEVEQKIREKKITAIEDQADIIRRALKEEIDNGLVTVDTDQLKIIIRIHEKGSFSSGKATLKAGFEPVMKKITHAVNNTTGIVHIAGHTDNLPITTEWYRSNWALAASRAVTVAHFMMNVTGTEENRMVVEGYADTKPLVNNDTPENRAKNRRVEIVIDQAARTES